MLENALISIADGSKIIGNWLVPIYWHLHFGRQNLQKFFEDSGSEFDPNWFNSIKPTSRSAFEAYMAEHFIITRISDGKYTIRDRNPPVNPANVYLNNRPVYSEPLPLNNGDVITIPLIKNNTTQACYIRFLIQSVETIGQPIKQPMQCSKTAKRYLVIWEEDKKIRRHFATRILKWDNALKEFPTIASSDQKKSSGFANLRPASESPCPYCGSTQAVFCPKCKTFICYDGKSEIWECKGCNQKYNLKQIRANNIDIKTI